MGWICGKKMKVKRGNDYVMLNPGDPVPEAEFWPDPQAWERQGFIRKINRVVPSLEVKAESVAEIEDTSVEIPIPTKKSTKKKKKKKGN